MKKVLTFLAVLTATSLSAQTFQQAATEADRRLQTALTELQQLEREVTQQKPPLGAELDRVEQEVYRMRNDFANASRIKSTFAIEVSQLDKRRQDIQNTNSYISSTLLNEYIRRFENTIDPGERQRYNDEIRAALEVMEGDRDAATRFTVQLKTVQTSLNRMQRVIGGEIYNGTASVAGVVQPGRFLQLGPVSYFVGDDGVAGISRGFREGLADVFVLDSHNRMISEAIANGQGTLPLDSTNGEAFTAIREQISLAEEIVAGGFVMYPILLLFAAAILIAVFKFIELSGVRSAKERDLREILTQLKNGNETAALSHAKSVGGPVGQLLVAAVESADQPREVIEEVLYEKIISTQPRLERFLPFIAVVAATAPLLGLLGTVTGMIKTFKLITIVGTGDARNLSSGISEALITTKYGLIVAIPSLIMHALLNRKAKGVVSSMEQTSVGFINGIMEMRGEQDSGTASDSSVREV